MYYIQSSNKTNSTVVVSPSASFVQSLKNAESQIFIKFGVRNFTVEIMFSNSIEPNQILLSKNMIDQLGIPLICAYDIKLIDNEIVIGPFIGILTELTNKKVGEMLPTYHSFFRGYKLFGGAVIVFSLEGIHMENRTITGFLYQPEKDTWTFDTFPYPAAVMSILEASLTAKWDEFHQKIKHLNSILGNRVFNYPHFSKWEMFNLLLPKLRNYLPATVLYQGVHDIENMLNLYKSVYIKPLNGRLGKHIYKVTRQEHKIIVQYEHNREKQERIFSNDPDIVAFFEANLVPGMYLVQQTIPLMTFQNSVIDFRVMTVKNEYGLWENLGMYSRYGANGLIVSNITAGGYTEIAEDTLKKIWKLTDKEINEITIAIGRIIREAIKILEQNGYQLGNIGFDIGLDKSGNIYIIEINHQNPDPYIAMKANDKKTFYLARFKNMMYAKYLGGF